MHVTTVVEIAVPNSDTGEFIDIDVAIAPLIIFLNYAGVRTLCSREGTNVERAYILMDATREAAHISSSVVRKLNGRSSFSREATSDLICWSWDTKDLGDVLDAVFYPNRYRYLHDGNVMLSTDGPPYAECVLTQTSWDLVRDFYWYESQDGLVTDTVIDGRPTVVSMNALIKSKSGEVL